MPGTGIRPADYARWEICSSDPGTGTQIIVMDV